MVLKTGGGVMEGFWQNVKTGLRHQLPEHSFKIWFEPLRFLSCEDNTLILECPNKFCVNWIRENYIDLLKREIKNQGKGSLDILLKVGRVTREKPACHHPQLSLPQIVESLPPLRRLNPAFTFGRFVTGNSNQFAYSAALNLTQGGNSIPNFVYYFSKTGLGKSHLAQAIGAEVHSRSPKQRVHYLSAEDFVNHMVYSIKNKSMDEFKNRFRRECDILILEEVHFLSGKEMTQGELSYTLDALLSENKKVVMTSYQLPREIPRIDNSLRSRLNSGLIISIDTPDYGTRVEILKRKAETYGIRLPEEVFEFIAHHIKEDVRQMESCLICMMARSSLAKQRLDLDLAQEVVKGFIDHKKQLDLDSIQKFIADSFHITVNDLKSRSRKQQIAFPRNIAIYFCRKYTEMTLENIGDAFQRNHATVLYALKTLETKIKRDRKIRSQIKYLGHRLEAFFLTENVMKNKSRKDLH